MEREKEEREGEKEKEEKRERKKKDFIPVSLYKCPYHLLFHEVVTSRKLDQKQKPTQSQEL